MKQGVSARCGGNSKQHRVVGKQAKQHAMVMHADVLPSLDAIDSPLFKVSHQAATEVQAKPCCHHQQSSNRRGSGNHKDLTCVSWWRGVIAFQKPCTCILSATPKMCKASRRSEAGLSTCGCLKCGCILHRHHRHCTQAHLASYLVRRIQLC